eukprot:6555207-Heterocapsa_arctica.AAC.1
MTLEATAANAGWSRATGGARIRRAPGDRWAAGGLLGPTAGALVVASPGSRVTGGRLVVRGYP